MQPQCFAGKSATTIRECLDSDSPSLAAIRKESGSDAARGAILWMLSEVTEFFSVPEKMSQRQIGLTVDLILEDYYFLKPEDIRLCFRNAMKGYYGRVYNRIDGQIILSWLKQYSDERLETAEQHSQAESGELKEKEQSPGGMFREEYIDRLRKQASQGDEGAKAALEAADSLGNLLKKAVFKAPYRMKAEKERERRERNAARRAGMIKELKEQYGND